MTPFQVRVSDEDLADLRLRVAGTRWPEGETVDDWSQGVPLAYARDLADYWAQSYDWRSVETRLNAIPQFVTMVDGVDIHFLHARSPHPNALPLLLTHGWPGSVLEFLDLIEPLTNPPNPADAFHVVVPSMPGFGFSGKPFAPGWKVERIAQAWGMLMQQLGYKYYGAHGGDLGSFVSAHLGHIDPTHVAGIHITMVFADAPPPEEQVQLTERDYAGLAYMKSFQQTESGYSAIMSTKPQTLGYGLTDSPVGQMAWIAEKFWTWTDHPGDLEKVISRDQLLDTVTLYWLTATAASAGRLYWESHYKVPNVRVEVPTACLLFPKDARMPRAWCERRFTDLRRWTDATTGGHFPALEQPGYLVDDLRAFFGQVRR
ncbi:hydrolase [Rhizocola hellebori]|uniref:Hydrolase n=1 Tax=Rhizocola hellebori TaxID=1392758 RepID=A0A8J3QDA8_9ACTN|nr:epoxide hydrolase family protein [Rhizocola hellebori]GIH07598.1 hydrolase [Rhizocola hellebori]